MKRLLIGSLLAMTSLTALADAPGGPNCGWGNMLFEGQRGLPPHFIASTTNGTSGNATFGMTSGTNGCSTDGTLTYGGKSWLAINGMLDELSEDMAKGEGEALTTYAVLLGVEEQDRAHFAAITHRHFSEIFSSPNVTGEQVHAATLDVIKRDSRLAKYAQPA
jgi:hypothetical protein